MRGSTPKSELFFYTSQASSLCPLSEPAQSWGLARPGLPVRATSCPDTCPEMGKWSMGTTQHRVPWVHQHPELNGQERVLSEAGWTLGQVGLHHVRLGGESVGLQTLQRHPLDRQASVAVLLDTVVLLVQDITGQTKVSHLDRE